MRHQSVGIILLLLLSLNFDGIGAEISTNLLNRLTLSPAAAFGLSAKFSAAANLPVVSGQRLTPDGAPYNYDNGYVLTDRAGNAGGQTWYWGYDNSSQISGNTILMSRSTLTSGATSGNEPSASGINFGGELAYDRELFARGEMHYGFEAGLSFLNVNLRGDSTQSADINQTMDAYPFTPGTTPPQAPPAYQGTFNGPGFLIGSSPVSTVTSVVPGGANITSQNKYEANVLGIRIGPVAAFPLLDRLQVICSGGFAAGFVDASVTWSDNVSFSSGGTAVNSGSGHHDHFLFGGYLGANFLYQISGQWSAGAGVHYQNLGTYTYHFSSRTVEVDFSKTIFISLAASYSF